MKRLVWVVGLTLAVMAVWSSTAFAGVSTSSAPGLAVPSTVEAGETITCGFIPGNDWSSDDGGTPVFSFYAWFYTSDENPGDEIFSGLSQATYTVQPADIGQQIVCEQVDFDNGEHGYGYSVPSAATSTIVPGPAPTSTGTLAVDGAVEVGHSLSCDANDVTWTPNQPGDTVNVSFAWQYAGGGPPAGTTTSSSTYSPVANDVSQQLECVETAVDATTGGTASTTSAATIPVEPLAAVTITEYSPTLAGNVGENIAGISVSASLEREDIHGDESVVATGSAATSAAGAWSLSLTPTAGSTLEAFGAPGDALAISYSRGTAPNGTVPPPTGTLLQSSTVPFDSSSSISADGSEISNSELPDCTGLQYLVNGVAESTSADASGCGYVPGAPVTADDHVQAAQTDWEPIDQGGYTAVVTAIDEVGLPGVPPGQGVPVCSADYVYGVVECDDLTVGAFTVTVNSSTTPLAISDDGGSYSGSALVPGLTAGETVTLRESGVSRALSVLHLGTLRVDEGAQPFERIPADVTVPAGGSCSPGELVGNFNSGSTNYPCPSSGSMPFAFGTSELDDLSGGYSTVAVPSLIDLIPTQGDSVSGVNWTAYADIEGHDSLGNSNATDLASVASVRFSVFPSGSGTAALNEAMTPGANDDGAFEAATVTTQLATGRYWADSLLTDSHGDTAAYSTQFAVEPADASGAGATGPQGPAGATGASGTTVPTAMRATASCKVTDTSKRSRVRCTVTYRAGNGAIRTRWQLRIRGRVARHGSSSLIHGRAVISPAHLKNLPAGRYTLQVSVAGHTASTTVRIRG
jgi:hypothetical protein